MASKQKTKDLGGRPTKFKPEYIEQSRKLCLLGMTDKEMADFFGVSERTLHGWKKSQPGFLQSLKSGKDLADAEVASKLYHRATGYEHADLDIRVIDEKIVKTKLVKHYPPDTTAAIFWLKNRNPGRWRDKPDALGLEDEAPAPVRVVVEVKDARRDEPDA